MVGVVEGEGLQRMVMNELGPQQVVEGLESQQVVKGVELQGWVGPQWVAI